MFSPIALLLHQLQIVVSCKVILYIFTAHPTGGVGVARGRSVSSVTRALRTVSRDETLVITSK